MSQQNYAALMKNALDEINRLRARLAAMEAQQNEPIAIVGMSCRFPSGATNPERFWALLRDEISAVTEIPADRWTVDSGDARQTSREKMPPRYGCFLEEVDTFDPSFFHISAREAVSLDPQQRLLLEVTWEALEYANIVPATLLDSSTGVFIGICGSNYKTLLEENPSPIEEQDLYTMTGTDSSLAAGRLSYVFGLTGPSVAVDTACSSSLVSVHQACQSLRQSECDLALAAGVGLLLHPNEMIAFSNGGMLAPDGRCKTFDAEANGYVRGEGCGVLVLKRLSDAIAAEDHILAVIRGSMVNHDGHSSGLTAPRGPAQVSVIRQALQRAGVPPGAVSYVEAHGTGTPLGDPIELDALIEVFGQRAEPLWVGAAKTNIGHLEAAAGVASLIKVVLMLQHKQIPANLHFHTPSSYIDWATAPVRVPTTLREWDTNASQDGKRVAGVSSFGFSGTNAHFVVSEAPARAAGGVPATERPVHLLTLSAKSPDVLAEMARCYQTYLGATDAPLADICSTASTGRTHFPYRLAVTAATKQQMQSLLAAYLAGSAPIGVSTGNVPPNAPCPKIAFRFHGEGSPGVQMGCELSDEYALSQLWRSWGIEPDVVIGEGIDVVLEMGPKPANESAWQTILEKLGHLYTLGVPVRWESVYPDHRRRQVQLPTYAWKRERYWITTSRPTARPKAEFSEWLYEVSWQSQALLRREEAASRGHWLIFADDGGTGDALAAHLCRDRDLATLVYPASSDCPANDPHPSGASCHRINPTRADDYDELLAALPPLTGVMHLWSLNSRGFDAAFDPMTEAQETGGTALLLIQAILRRNGTPPDVWLVTENAQAVRKDDGVNGALQSCVWGMRNVVAAEHPELRCTAIDLDDWTVPEDRIRFLAAELKAAGGAVSPNAPREDRVAVRDGVRYVSRLTPHRGSASSALRRIRPDATYLVTGGLGGLGLVVARWLVEHGATRLVLMGRRPPTSEAQQEIRELTMRGTRVVLAQADVSIRADVASALARIENDYPLAGIIHAAGVLDDGVVLRQDWTRFRKVLAPKLEGAWHLHTLTAEMPLDFFVCFSSAAGVLGNRGQANYAAANTFLDAFAHFRQARGWRTLSIDWDAWSGVGMATGLKQPQDGRSPEIAPEKGLEILGSLLQQSRAQVVAICPEALGRIGDKHSAFLASLAPLPATVQPGQSTAPFVEQLRLALPKERMRLLLRQLQDQVATALRSPQPPAVHQSFTELGMDSLIALELKQQIEDLFQLPLCATVAFDHPSVERLARFLLPQLVSEPQPERAHEVSRTHEAGGDSVAEELSALESLLDGLRG